MKKWIFVVALVVIAGFFLFSKDKSQTASVANNLAGGETATQTNGDTNAVMDKKEGEEMMKKEGEAMAGGEGAMMAETVITYTDAGFTPKEVTVKKGSKVKFMNNSSTDMWPASAVHPSHTVYPGSGIAKCSNPAEASMIFDACRDITPGSSYSFMFNEVGSWNFHDHLSPTKFGKIIVTAE